MQGFNGKIAVITGAGSGIGQALALELASLGARLALSDVSEQGLAETRSMISAESPRAEVKVYRLDVATREAVFAHAEQVKADFGTAHYLFNNAGVALFATVENMTLDELDWLLGINLFGVIYGTKAFLPMMRAQDEGHIVNISSVLGLFATPASSAYVISKFGVRGFTEALARELEGSNVFASCVHPGGIKTKIETAGRMGVKAGQFERQCVELARRNLKTEPRDLAKSILLNVTRRNRRIVVGEAAKLVDMIVRLFPTGYGRIFRAIKGL